jgi:AAA15 family ATPase/GTPase
MKITKLHITNFKSIKELELINPNPFSVFVGPNGAGKSNIFEALEFAVYFKKFGPSAINLFGGEKSILNFKDEYELSQHFELKTISNYVINMDVHFRRGVNGLVHFANAMYTHEDRG